MIKTKTKVSGGFRSLEGGIAFMNIRSLIGTVKEHGRSVFQAVCDVFNNVEVNLTNQ